MSDQPVTTIAVVVVCFMLGFWIVGQLIKKSTAKKAERKTDDPRVYGRDSKQEREREDERQFASIEAYHRHVIGVSESAGELEIKAAYRQLLAKYHPDKVNHLGDEFLDLAGRRTKELIEAYDYLKTRYGFR